MFLVPTVIAGSFRYRVIEVVNAFECFGLRFLRPPFSQHVQQPRAKAFRFLHTAIEQHVPRQRGFPIAAAMRADEGGYVPRDGGIRLVGQTYFLEA